MRSDPIRPACDDIVMMLTIEPPALRPTMSVIAACMRKNGPRRLTAMCWSNRSGEVSSMVPRVVRPAVASRQAHRVAAVFLTAVLASDLQPVVDRIAAEPPPPSSG